LLGYLFWFGIALGSLPLNMLQHITGGAWGLSIRRLLEASTRTLPLMAVLFVPIVLGMHSLYSWSRPDLVAADEVLRHKAPYLNPTFWLVRTVVYFAIWIGCRGASTRGRASRTVPAMRSCRARCRRSPGPAWSSISWRSPCRDRLGDGAGAPLVLHDLRPADRSRPGLNAFAFVVMMLALLVRYEPFAPLVGPPVFHDLGKLMLAFVMVWAYFSFSQFLIIWPETCPKKSAGISTIREAAGWASASSSTCFTSSYRSRCCSPAT
jgi:hypothetical protein